MTNTATKVVDFGIATIIKEVQRLPKEWALIPVGGKKAPLYSGWQQSGFKAGDFEKAATSNVFEGAICKADKPDAFTLPSKWVRAAGVLCGEPSGGLLFLDHDGLTADAKILELSGCETIKQALPRTPVVKSGRLNRYQAIYKIGKDFWPGIETKKFGTKFETKVDENGEEKQVPVEMLELRWTGAQSVVVGTHPETDGYYWHYHPEETPIADAPMWIIEAMLTDGNSTDTPQNWPDFDKSFSLPCDQRPPLLVACSKKTRDAIESHKYSEGRNDTGAAIARDLLGTAKYLDSVGQQYDGDPRAIFFGWCDDVGLTQDQPKGQPKTIWKSAEKNRPSPSLNPDMIEGCIKAWAWKNKPVQGELNLASAPVTAPDKASVPDHSEAPETPDYDDVLDVVDQLEESEPDESRLHWELSNFAYEQGLKARGFNADYLLKQARARRDRLGVLELEDTHDIMEANPERRWVVGGLLPANSVAIIGAPGGIGKTVLLYDIAKAIATGHSWSGLPTVHGKVLIVQVDEPKTDTSDKLHEACFDAVPKGAITWCRRWRFTQTRQLFQIINKLKPNLVIIDSITAAHAGTDTDMISSKAGDCVYKLRDFAETADWGVSFWLVHHVNKGAVVGLRDSSTFKDNASEIQLLAKPKDGDWPKDFYCLNIEKSRAGLQGEYMIERDTLNYGWKFMGLKDAPASVETISNYLGKYPNRRFSPKELGQEIGIETDAAGTCLEILRRMCSVKSERKTYIDKKDGKMRAFRLYYANPDAKQMGGIPPPKAKAVEPEPKPQELPLEDKNLKWVG
ncbi:hypothetical protein D0962_01780 [Leptolyngbyaceae cyanobacterium CCMR0082]|uniref:DNA primase/polymerase bifunctional N-terminal domain-containing protein n=1 Tax=Adonisia turfae CCMR0082 TaxID=2304604 RepID=A0A6M0RZ84_9CYAN|nr:AAA family ATPase [Adonisia turfae]NEZ61515.1 hypothetical protein [Adonisia turfae CCMR0082]